MDNKNMNLRPKDLFDRMRANIRLDHAPTPEDEQQTGPKRAPSLEPLFQLAALTGYQDDAVDEKDFYGGLAEQPDCWGQVKKACMDRLDDYRWNPGKQLDAEAKVYINPDRLEAWCFVLPPLNGGSDMNADRLRHILDDRGVIAGVDQDAVTRAGTPDGYLVLTKVAQGLAAQRGKDGYIVDLVSPPDEEHEYEEDERGRINFAEKRWIVNVNPDQRLCEIFQPTEGKDGFDVFGHRLEGRAGRPVGRINGTNTTFTQDGRYLVATEEGQLVRLGERFTVSQVLTINGNIDYSTGNIRANGSVVIYGNVMPTFHVQARHDIIIHGTVEGATVVAGHDLTILGGVMASREGFVHAGNDLRCKFMENARAYCGNDAYFENLILCNVSAEGSIYVTSGRGSVVGGSLVAMGDIRIGTLGNRTYRASQIRIQQTRDFLERKARCNADLEEARDAWKSADENVARLDAFRDNPQVAEIVSHQESLLNLADIKITNLKLHLNEFADKERDMETRRIYIKHAFPNGNLGICGSAMVLHQEIKFGVFAYKKGEIKMVADRDRGSGF